MKKSLVLMVVLVLVAAMSSFAQGNNNQAAPATMTLTDQGIIVLHSGVIAKIDAVKLVSKGVIELFGPMPAAPAAGAARADRRAYYAELNKRNASPVMIAVSDEKAKTSNLFVIVGDQFVNIDLITFKALINVSIAAPVDPAAAPAPAPGAGGGATVTPVLQYNAKDGILYVLKGTEISSVNVVDGKVAARGSLPKEMIPAAPAAGANPNPGGGPGGGRTRQPPAPAPAPAVPAV